MSILPAFVVEKKKKNMNNNELMIGDIVSLYGTPCRVIMLSKDNFDLENLFTGTKIALTTNATIEPIPLTESLLEKNEIYYQWAMPWYQGGADGVFQIRYMSDDTETEVKVPCRYLHEVQHLFKLCGIEKEWKVF